MASYVTLVSMTSNVAIITMVSYVSFIITITIYITIVTIAYSLGFQNSFSKTCILRKSCRVFHDRSLLGRCFLGFVLPVLEYCSSVWCSAADTYLELLDCVVSGARFLTGGVFESDIAHRRSVAVLCIL